MGQYFFPVSVDLRPGGRFFKRNPNILLIRKKKLMVELCGVKKKKVHNLVQLSHYLVEFIVMTIFLLISVILLLTHLLFCINAELIVIVMHGYQT
jgi:hypothetical protein